jgi:hypothetical protein
MPRPKPAAELLVAYRCPALPVEQERELRELVARLGEEARMEKLPELKLCMEKIMSQETRKTPWVLWPVMALWRLLAFIIELTGRLAAIILGVVLMIMGVMVSFTIIGAIIGLPLILFGFLLVIRGFF